MSVRQGFISITLLKPAFFVLFLLNFTEIDYDLSDFKDGLDILLSPSLTSLMIPSIAHEFRLRMLG